MNSQRPVNSQLVAILVMTIRRTLSDIEVAALANSCSWLPRVEATNIAYKAALGALLIREDGGFEPELREALEFVVNERRQSPSSDFFGLPSAGAA